MHLAEGLLPASQAGAYFVTAAPFVVSSFRAIRTYLQKSSAKEKAFFQLSIALCFAVTLIPVPNPLVAATSHMCATPLLALLFGPRLMVLPIALILLLQAVFFAHGGLSTLGANVFTLALVGPFSAYGIHYLLNRLGLRTLWSVGISCAIASLLVYVADSAILALSLSGEKPYWTWFSRISLSFFPIQFPLSVLEGILSALFLRSLSRGKLVPIPKSLAVAMVFVAFVTIPSSNAHAYQGLDEKVFEGLADQAGVKARPGIFDIEGDLLLSFFSIAMFASGLFIGKRWAEIKSLSRETD